jgi:hypothetical protein
MSLLSSGSLSLIERITGTSALLFLVVITLYIDVFVSLRFEQSVFLIKENWHLDRVSLGDWLLFLLGFSFLYGAVVPVLINITDPRLAAQERKNKSIKDDQQRKIPLSEIREFAITENNTPAYQFYQEQNIKLEQFKVLRKHSIAIVLLFLMSLFTYHLGTPNDQSIISSSFARLSEEGPLIGILRILSVGFAFYIMGIAWGSDQFYELSNLAPTRSSMEKRKQREWLTELSVGLIELHPMREHLRIVIDVLSEFTPSTVHATDSIEYCRRRGLVNKEKLELTEKGKFFSQYL